MEEAGAASPSLRGPNQTTSAPYRESPLEGMKDPLSFFEEDTDRGFEHLPEVEKSGIK